MLHPPPPLTRGMFLLLLTTTTTTTVQAFPYSAATRQRHDIIRANPLHLNSALNLFGRRNYHVENRLGGVKSSNGNRSNNTNSHQTDERGGVLRTDVLRFDSKWNKDKAKTIRDPKKGGGRHAWKQGKFPGDERRDLPIVLTRALCHWRGLAQKLRYALQRNTVYVLECEDGKYYVGSTKNRRQRYREHFESRRKGSKWTRLHRPLRVVEEWKRVPGRYLMGAESQVTSERMLAHGVNNVRGAAYCQLRDLTTDDVSDLTSFLGHYNRLDYYELTRELERVLPRPEPPPPAAVSLSPPNDERGSKDIKFQRSTNKKKSTVSVHRTFQNYKRKERLKKQKLRKLQQAFNRWESDAAPTSGSMDPNLTYFPPEGHIRTAADDGHLFQTFTATAKEKTNMSKQECFRVLLHACVTLRHIQLDEGQRKTPWIMALLVHRYDRGLRELDDLNRVPIYEGDSREKADATGTVTSSAAPAGYIDLRQVLTPLPEEVHAYITCRNKDGDRNNPDPVFDFTIESVQRALEALRIKKIALLGVEARRVLLECHISPSTLAPSLGTEADARTLFKEDPTTFLSLFSKAFALYEKYNAKEC